MTHRYVAQVSKLERVLKEEKAARERQVAELEAYAAQLEDELELEHRRRLNEQLCALIEGAPFTMYKSSEVSERHVWFRYHPSYTVLHIFCVLLPFQAVAKPAIVLFLEHLCSAGNYV